MSKFNSLQIIKIISAVLLVSVFPVKADHVPDHLPKPVEKMLKKFRVPDKSLSLYIKEHNATEPLAALNIDVPRNPASVIKILTTFAALELLGPNYTWETHFHIDGKITNDTLNGNLIIQGGGDPFLVKETFWQILHTLQARGLKNINGDLLIDDGLFEDETGSTADFDNKPHRVYNAFPDAALVNFRAHQFYFIPKNNKVLVYADPDAANMQIRNKIKLVSGKCRGRHRNISMHIFTQGVQTVVEFSGDYPRSCGEQELLRTIMPNDQYIFGVFKSLWEEMGGTISGTYGKVSVNGSKPIYIVPSRPLSDIITLINKFSNNVMARQLLLTIGQEELDTKGSKDAGRRTIKNWLSSIGIPATELVLDNGSGLSRNTRVSAHTLGMLLEHAYASPYQPEFFASLPLVGVDGTVRKRLNGKIPPGFARIKTGLINDVRAMAGYVRSRSGKEYFVVSLQNYPGIQNTTGTLVQDEILKWLYDK